MQALNWDELGLGDDAVGTEGGYEHNIAFKAPPIATYNVRIIPESCEWTSKEGVLRLKYDAVRVGGDYDNVKIRFNWATSKKMSNRNASSLEDLGFALGMKKGGDETLPLKDIGEFIQGAINEGTQFRARTDWESYCPDCGETVLRGKKAYDLNKDGTRNPAKPCPQCGKITFARDRIAAAVV